MEITTFRSLLGVTSARSPLTVSTLPIQSFFHAELPAKIKIDIIENKTLRIWLSSDIAHILFISAKFVRNIVFIARNWIDTATHAKIVNVRLTGNTGTHAVPSTWRRILILKWSFRLELTPRLSRALNGNDRSRWSFCTAIQRFLSVINVLNSNGKCIEWQQLS